ncbi:MAG: flagellar basal body-associated protein FliL [Methylotenera sp.]|uniref:flagellar basal body-associated protein FliL n=1 Tax=Methylotenera sp. TaxID=2051956 RepID=UPI0024873112|nr:flagellar basal body-associated protein FliL [Methylotenera sp.]MDI1308511.1 flagellar basal body-associated protein FliL [Methylotenera sp.]
MAADPKPKGAEEPAETAPKSKKKLIVMIAVAVLLAGGAGAGWFLTHQKSDHKKEVKHEEPAQVPVFVSLDVFTVNLQPDPDDKFLQTEISLQVANAEQAELLKAQMPAVRSRLLMLLTSKTASDISTSEGKQKLSDEIVAEIVKPFSKNAKPQEVLGVFFTSFVIQ